MDYIQILEYPVRGIWQGRNPFDIFEEDANQEMEKLQQSPIIFDPFSGFLGANPYYRGPGGMGPSA